MTNTAQDEVAIPPKAARVAWFALVVLVHYWCLFDGLAAIGLTGPDEPRYAAIAREMAETGDWVTPRLHGKEWFEKPILYYWAAAVQYKLWGDTEVAARLPSALAATATSAALGWLALRLYGWGAAQVVLLLFPSTVAAIGFGRAATTDMLFSAALALAMVAATRIVRPARLQGEEEVTIYAGAKPAPRSHAMTELLWRAGFGAALGLAALAKGPAALILAGGSTGLWTIATRRWRDGFTLASPAAVLTFALVALPWYVLCALRNPEFVDVFLISHNVRRFLTPVFQHEQPFWFFGPILLLGLVPWTPLLLGVARDGIGALGGNRWRSAPSFFLACWVIFPVLFFSASKSKLPGYVLPVIPPLALLLARSLSEGMAHRDQLTRWLLAATGMVLVFLGGAAGTPSLVAARMPGATPDSLLLLAIVPGIAGALTVLLASRRRLLLSVALAALCIAASARVLTGSILPQMDAQISARALARFVAAPPEQRGKPVAVHQLHRAWHYGLNYYLQREVPVWTPGSDTLYIVTNEAGLADLRKQDVPLSSTQMRISPRAIVAIRVR